MYKRFKKNNSDDQSGPKERGRPAGSLDRATRSLAAFTFEANKRLIARLREPRLSPKPSTEREPYACQHAMLHALDRLVKGSLDTRKSNAAMALSAEGGSPSWQLVYDKCEGLVALISGQAAMGGKILFLLGQLRQALDIAAATAHQDPGFLIQIWRTCMCLLDVRFPGRTRTNRFIFLRVFLHWLRSSFLARLRNPKDDLVVLVECLIRVLNFEEPFHFMATLGMGCGKTMDMVGGMVGHSHAVILTMGSSCTRYWKREFAVDRGRFERHYKPLVDQIIHAQ